VAINHVSLRAQEPAFGVNAMSGTIRRQRTRSISMTCRSRARETSLRVNGSIQNIEGSSPAVDLTASSDKFDVGRRASSFRALRGYHMQPAFEITKGRRTP
jgi:hypothetical protein